MSNNDYALVPLNKDGSINIKISEEQLNEIKPLAIQSVNLQQIRGDKAMYVEGSAYSYGNALVVVNCTGTHKCD